MAYKVSWIVPNRVLYILQTGDITLEDIRLSSVQIADHLESAYASSGGTMVIGVVDMRDIRLGHVMRSVVTAAVKDIANVIDSRVWRAKPGFVVLITGSDSAKLLVSLIIRISSQPLTTVGTMAEALTVVSYMYPELKEELDQYRDSDEQAQAAP